MTYSLQSYQDENSVDLVESVLGDSEVYASYGTKAARTIWAMYRYAILNTSDSNMDRWIQRGKDIAYNMDERYVQLFKAYEQFKSEGLATSIDMTDTGTSTTESSGTDSGTTESTATDEAIPQYADASNGTWLTSRTKASGSSNGTSTGSATTTDTRTTTGGNLPVELIQRMKQGLFNPYMEYAGEFRELFVPFYVDEGCGCCA